MKKGKSKLIERRNNVGYFFIALWIIGVIFFFLKPAIQTLIYAFSDVIVKDNMATTFIGLENFRKILFEDIDYVRDLTSSLTDMLYEVPIIVIFSMFIAGILNQEFKGRTFARVLFFLPVIIASGISIEILSSNGMSTDVSGKDTVFMFKTVMLENTLAEIGISSSLVSYFAGLINRIFNICWKSGIQILLFLAGLQTVPKSYYEVSSMEGATAWEEFWKITFPLLSPYTLVCVVYTIIDSFTYYQNKIMMLIKTSYDAQKYGYSAAESWLYFVVILVILLLVTKLIFRNVVHIDE